MSGVKRHPIRGLLGGLLAGIGVALLLVVTAQIALGTLTPLIVVVVGTVLGLLWAMFGPVRRRRGASAPGPGADAAGGAGAAAAPAAPSAAGPTPPTTPGWSPTHVAPRDGLVTYAGAEEGGGENGRLAPGLPVQVVERQGQWARIVCSNGWAAWVDGARLIEGPKPEG